MQLLERLLNFVHCSGDRNVLQEVEQKTKFGMPVGIRFRWFYIFLFSLPFPDRLLQCAQSSRRSLCLWANCLGKEKSCGGTQGTRASALPLRYPGFTPIIGARSAQI